MPYFRVYGRFTKDGWWDVDAENEQDAIDILQEGGDDSMMIEESESICEFEADSAIKLDFGEEQFHG